MDYVEHLLGHEEGPVVLMQARSTRRAVAGFTIIELMVTVTLVAILVGLAVPAFNAWISNAQVRTVAEALQNGIRTAQAEAVRRNRQVVLSFTNATPALNAAAVANGKNWSLQTVASLGDTAGDYLQGGAMADVASTTTITSGVSAICFNANGRLVTNTSPGPAGASCTASPTTFNVTQPNADRNLNVLVQIGGQLRMCDPKRTLSSTSPDGCPVP